MVVAAAHVLPLSSVTELTVIVPAGSFQKAPMTARLPLPLAANVDVIVEAPPS